MATSDTLRCACFRSMVICRNDVGSYVATAAVRLKALAGRITLVCQMQCGT